MSTSTPPHTGQIGVAVALAASAYELAQISSTFPVPFDAYRLVERLAGTTRSLAETLDQAAVWHTRTRDGEHFDIPPSGGNRSATLEVAGELAAAARHMREATAALERAHTASGTIAWRGRLG